MTSSMVISKSMRGFRSNQKKGLKQPLQDREDITSAEEDVAKAAHEIDNSPAVIYEEAAMMTDLLDNARDAMSSGGTITVRTRASSAWAIVEIEDNGIGMSPEVVENAFSPFYTTKAEGRGTGLGLSISRDIIACMEGRIDAKSEEGKGTLTALSIPIDGAGEERLEER
jgi:signal transduction histidine kinase